VNYSGSESTASPEIRPVHPYVKQPNERSNEKEDSGEEKFGIAEHIPEDA
jgi:hypothetical protein